MSRLRILQFLSHTSWGADKFTMLNLYRSLIRSKLDYACFIYGTASPSTLKTLDAIHNTGIRISTGAFKSSPSSSLCIEAREPPLYYRRQLLLAKHLAKMKSFNTFPETFKELLTFKNQLYLSVFRFTNFNDVLKFKKPIFPFWQTLPTENVLNVPVIAKANLSQAEMRQNFFSVIDSHAEHKPFYTDGSKTVNSTACAFSCDLNEIYSFKLSPVTSIFTAEALAISKALNYVHNTDCKQSIICSDSYSVLSALGNPNNPHPILTQIQNLVFTLISKNFSILFCWCPGHVNIPGNVRVDSAARESSLSIGPFSKGSVTSKDLFLDIKGKILHHWVTEWQHFTNAKCPPALPTSPSSENFHLTRLQQVVQTRLRIGHTNFSHSYLMTQSNRPACTSCPNSPLTVDHVLISCPLYKDIRKRFFPYPLPSLKNLLLNTHPVKLFEFMRSTNLKI